MNIPKRIILLLLISIGIFSGCTTIKPYDPELSPEEEIRHAEVLDELWSMIYRNMYSLGIREANTALQKYPGDPEILRARGLIYFGSGEQQKALDDFLLAVSIAPTSPQSVVVRDFVAMNFPLSLERIAAVSTMNGYLAKNPMGSAIYREGILGQIGDSIRAASPSPTLVSSGLKAVTGWQILGSFPNLSHEGFEHLPIKDTANPLESTETAVGINLQTVRWITPVTDYNTGWVNPSRYYEFNRYASFYSTAQLDIPEDGTYTLIFSQRGAMRVWVDGVQIHEDREYRRSVDSFWYQMDLTAGYHTILVNSLNMDELAGFRVSLQQGGFEASENHPNDPLLSELASEPAAYSGTGDRDFWYAYMLMIKDQTKELGNMLAKFSEQDYNRSEFIALIRENSTIDNVEGGSSQVPAPQFPGTYFLPSVKRYMLASIEMGRYGYIIDTLKNMERKYGDIPEISEYEFLLKIARGEYDDARDVYNNYTFTFPATYSLEADYLSEYGTDNGYASDFVDRLAGGGIMNTALSYRYDIQQDRSYNSQASVATLERLMALYPDNGYLAMNYLDYEWDVLVNYYSYLETITEYEQSFGQLWRFQEAKERILNILLLIWEYQEKYATSSYTLIQEELDTARNNLKDYYETMLDAQAGEFELWLRYYNRISEENLSFDVTTIDDMYQNEITIEAYPGADAVEILNETVDFFVPNGASRHFYAGVLRILTPNGVLNERSQELPFIPGYSGELTKAYAIKSNGDIINPEQNGRFLSFPGLEVNDTLVIEFKYDDALTGAFTHDVWDQVIFSSIYPIQKRWHRIYYPSELDPEFVEHNTEDLEIVQSDIQIVSADPLLRLSGKSYIATDIPAMPIEYGDIEWQDLYSWVDISTVTDWKDIVLWYQDMYYGRTRTTPSLLKLAQQLTEGLESEQEKVEALYEYVTYNVEYEDLRFMYSAYIPQSPESVISDRFGDCKDQSALLIALMRAIGIDARIALSTPDYRGEHHYLPSSRFTHAIVITELDGKTLFLDPTTKYYSFGETPESLRGTYYLEIPGVLGDVAPVLERVPADEPRISSEIIHEMQLNSTQATITTNGTFHGNPAAYMRAILDLPDEQSRMSEFATYMRSLHPEVQITAFSSSDPADLIATAEVHFESTTSHPLVSLGSGRYGIKLPWMNSIESWNWLLHGTEDERRSGILIQDYRFASPIIETFFIEIQGNGRVDYLPPSRVYEFEGIRVEFSFTRTGTGVTAVRQIFMPTTFISAEQYNDFHTFLLQVLTEQQAMISVTY